MGLCALVLSALIPNLVAATDRKDACPVTTPPEPPWLPPVPYKANAGQGAFWYGSDTLWTKLGAEGVWKGLPRRDNGYFNKLVLWQEGYDWRKEPKPDIFLVLRRLDAQAPLAISRGGTNAFIDGVWTMLTGVIFPTEGCWEVTSYHDGTTMAFVVLVQP